MTPEELVQRSQQIADLIVGLELRDAIDVVGHACQLASKSNPHYGLITMYNIADLVVAQEGRRAIIEVTDKGGVKFTVEAKKVKGLNVKM